MPDIQPPVPNRQELHAGFRALKDALEEVTGSALPPQARDALARLAGAAMNADSIVVLESSEAGSTVQAEWVAHPGVRRTALDREPVECMTDGPVWKIGGGRWHLGVPLRARGKLWGSVIASGDGTVQPSAFTEDRLAAFGGVIAAAVVNGRTVQEVDRLVLEQDSLRYVAEKVAASTDPDEVFDIVVREVGILSGVQGAKLLRYETDGTATFFAGWGPLSGTLPTGTRLPARGTSVTGRIWATGVPSRVDDYPSASGPVAKLLTSAGMKSAVGVPIRVNGQLWGAFAVGSSDAPLPPDTEQHLAKYAGLVSSLIGNLVARQALLDSRVRLVHAADSTRQRIERDLHDGVQQRLIAAKMAASLAADLVRTGEDPREALVALDRRLSDAIEQLRDISRGIHPSILSEGGLEPALRSLARRAGFPVELNIDSDFPRLEPFLEGAAYFMVSEAITNAIKHSRASLITIRVRQDQVGVIIIAQDDGVGGADCAHGSGLTGLIDRLEAVGGSLRISSPIGDGTTLVARLPGPSIHEGSRRGQE